MKALIFLLSLLTITVIGSSSMNSQVYADNPLGGACDIKSKSDKDTANASACKVDESKNPISGGTNSLLFKITIMISAIAGTIAVIIMVVAGISMMTSAGDSQKFANARNTIIFAVVGLIVIAIAQSLISFVIIKVTT